MLALTRTAEILLDSLLADYERKNRVEAQLKLLKILEEVSEEVLYGSPRYLPAPRPFPRLAAHGYNWILYEDYWFAFTKDAIPAIVYVFYASARVPGLIKMAERKLAQTK